MSSDVNISRTRDWSSKASMSHGKMVNLDIANVLAQSLRTNTMKLSSEHVQVSTSSREAYFNKIVDIHKHAKSLPVMFHNVIQTKRPVVLYNATEPNRPVMLHNAEEHKRKNDHRSFSYKPVTQLFPNTLGALYRQTYPKNLKILSEEGRMHTFLINGWSSSRWYPRFLANAGFYYRGNGTEVHCFKCNIKTDVSTWTEDVNPEQAHVRLAKNCPFVIDNGFIFKLGKRQQISKDNSSTKSNNGIHQSCEQDGNLTNLQPVKQKIKVQTITERILESNDESSGPKTPTAHFDIMVDSFNGLTTGKPISQGQSSPSGHHVGYRTEHEVMTVKDEAPPIMDTMNSQITQDGLQSYHQEFKYPQFQSVDARYRSFDTWRFAHKQTPITLSEAGYFYTGENDIVRCFCCDLGLAEWDPKDNPWIEHARHNPKCWFLLSEKGEQFIESIQQDWKKIYNPKHAAFDDKESRIATFDGWRTDIEQTPEILADAGFFYTGEEDTVRCHYCDGGLRNWEPRDVPWEEHARWFPFCKFVIKMKGREFIEYIKRKSEEKQRLENSTSNSSSSGLPGMRIKQKDDIGDSEVVKQLKILGIDEENIRYAVTEFRKRTGKSNFTTEALTELIFNRNDQHEINSPFAAKNFVVTEKPEEQDPKKIKELNRKLKDKMKCIRCRTNDICMLFVNCGHRQTCEECADLMDFCPICDTRIKKRLKTFLS